MTTRVDAGGQRYGPQEALALARAAARVVIARGQRVVEFDMKNAPPDDALLKALLGPTGNLRAPTIRKGRTLYVGFSPEVYEQLC